MSMPVEYLKPGDQFEVTGLPSQLYTLIRAGESWTTCQKHGKSKLVEITDKNGKERSFTVNPKSVTTLCVGLMVEPVA
jgi:hypothetical protein